MGLDLYPGLRVDGATWPGVLHRYGSVYEGVLVMEHDDRFDEDSPAEPEWATRHHRWAMSYGGFGRFRELLAEAAGFDVDAVWKRRKLNKKTGEYETVFSAELKAPIPELIIHHPDDDPIGDPALEPFIWHSDCDGFMTADECRQVAPRLRELAPRVGELTHDPEWGKRAEDLADIMQAVADDPTGLAILRFH